MVEAACDIAEQAVLWQFNLTLVHNVCKQSQSSSNQTQLGTAAMIMSHSSSCACWSASHSTSDCIKGMLCIQLRQCIAVCLFTTEE